MRILLLNPPQAQPFLPQLALPMLAGSLRRAGHQVTVRDLNLESYEDFLSPSVLVRAGISPENAPDIQKAKDTLRCGEDYLNPDTYSRAIARINQDLSIISSSYYLTRWSLKNYQVPPYQGHTSADILTASDDAKKNLFVDYFADKCQEILNPEPDLVGISISWQSQMIPAFTLARAIKNLLPHVHICLGGSLMGHLREMLQENRSLFGVVDSILPMEADDAITELAVNLPRNRFSRVPGLIYRWEDQTLFNQPAPPVDLSSLPHADFDGLPLDRYYSPRTYLPIASSRGCYWGRCTFCTHHLSGNRFRPRKARDVFYEMKHQYEKHQCRHFYFVDDSLPPGLIRKVAGMIRREGLPILWAGEIRMERHLGRDYFRDLYRGGCRMLLFGLESADSRILNLINKGIHTDSAARVIKSASNEGIITWVFFFLGFPGERRHEARRTFRFILENREHIDMLAGGGFTLTRNSQIHQRQDEFGIISLETPAHQDLLLNFQYTLREGMDKNQVNELLRRFREKPMIQKYLHSFVSEPHMLFFRKETFRQQ